MEKEAVLTGLGYVPNEALMAQMEKIEKNTNGYGKILKHILDLHTHLRVNDSFVALSNTKDHFKIKVEVKSPELEQEAHKKIKHFSEKFKIDMEKLQSKNTYYIKGFNHQ